MNRAGEAYEEAVSAGQVDLFDRICWAVVIVSTSYIVAYCWIPFLVRWWRVGL